MSAGKTIVVLQARMGSRRLPGKVLEDLEGRTLLAHCVTRLRVSAVGPVMVATTTLALDDAIARAADQLGAPVCRGEEDDVLARFVRAARQAQAEFVVRATCDNPAVDLLSAHRLLEALRRARADHAIETGMPIGGTVEVVRVAALAAAAEAATEPADREHVTTFLRRRPRRFRCLAVTAPSTVCRPDLRFTVDTAEDLAYMRQVFHAAGATASRTQPLETLIAASRSVPRRQEVA